MHIYIYDSFLTQKKYSQALSRIETRTTDLGLNGKIIRLGAMNSLPDAVESEVRKGAKTITVVGNDGLLHQAIDTMARLSDRNIMAKNIPIGFIPVGKKDNSIARYLGIAAEEKACDILSARRIETLDLGQANDEFFFTEATISSLGTTIEIDDNYSIEASGTGVIGVINLPASFKLLPDDSVPGRSRALSLYIKTGGGKKFLPLGIQRSDQSIFAFKKLRIGNVHNLPVMIDGTTPVATPVTIEAAKAKISLIVGRGRKF